MDSQAASSSSSQTGVVNGKKLIIYSRELGCPDLLSPSPESMTWYAYLKYAIMIFDIGDVSDENIRAPALKLDDKHITDFKELRKALPLAEVQQEDLLDSSIQHVKNALLLTLLSYHLQDPNRIPWLNDFNPLLHELELPKPVSVDNLSEKMPVVLSDAETAFETLSLRLSDSAFLLLEQARKPSAYDAKLIGCTSIISKILVGSPLHQIFLKYSNIIGHVERFYSLLVDEVPVNFSDIISESALYESIENNGVFIGGGQYGKIYVHTVEDGDPTGLPPGSYAFKIQRQGYYQHVKGEIEFRMVYRLLYGDRMLKMVGFGFDDACRRACLVTEYISGGQLKDKLHDLELQSIVKVLHDIAYGLHLVHSHLPDPIIHGDAKSENVLLKGDKALLCDFGTITSVGGLRLRNDPVYDDRDWGFIESTKDEIYFIGVLLFEMITKVPVKRDKGDPLIRRVGRLIPDSRACENQIQERLLQPGYDRELIAQLIELGKKCICEHATERLAAFQVADELYKLMHVR